MAEIKIEKKKPMWPWLLVGLGIVVVLMYFMASRENDKIEDSVSLSEYENKTNDSDKPDLLGVKENNATVAAYINFVETSNGKMSLDHEFTNEGLLKLIDATKAMAGVAGYTIQVDLEKIKGYANIITKEPFETTHADYIRIADDSLAHVLQNIQEAKYPTLANDIEELKRAAESINPNEKTLQQKDAVKNYFEKASELLKKMN